MKITNTGRFTRYIIAVFTVVFFSAGLMSACGGRPGDDIVVAGSTSVQPYAEVLAEEFAILNPGSNIDVQGGGSSAGITAVESGTADIGMSSRALKDDELQMLAIEIARDGLAVIIHPKNPLSDLSLHQIRDIYTQKVSDWSELGGSKAQIHIIAREEGSGTRSAFEELVMNDEFISPKAIIQDSNGAVKQLVSGDSKAIGFISLGLVDDTVKSLKLNGVTPTAENVTNGSYSLFRPFLFVMNEEPYGLTRQFIDFILSPKGQQILINDGLIPTTGEVNE